MATTRLFEAYAAGLGVDLTFQDFAGELRAMPGKYAHPSGELLLARDSRGEAVGCVALRALEVDGCCEMKRLYAPPQARGLGIGKALVDAVLDVGTLLGYREMLLDSLPSLAAAVSLYQKAGFVPVSPYYHNPEADVMFLGCRLPDRPLSAMRAAQDERQPPR